MKLAASMIAFSILLFFSFSQQNISQAYNIPSSVMLPTNAIDTAFLTYQNNGIQLQYPTIWNIKETGGTSIDNITDIVGFSPPNDVSSAEVMVSFDSSSDNESLTSYLSDVIASGQEDYKDFKVISANTISTLSGSPAYLLLISYVDAGITYDTLETGTKINNKVYFISYDVEASNYTLYLPSVHKMIDSFKVLNYK